MPLEHRSYRVLERMAALGLVPLRAISARPITREEARRLVEEAWLSLPRMSPEVARLVRDDLEALRREFAASPAVEARIGVGNSSSLAAHYPLGGVLFSGRLATDSPAGVPRSELYASFRLGSVEMQLGRASVFWGPSLRTGLLLSDAAGTLPLFRLTADLPRARLTKVLAWLERSGGTPAGDVAFFATRLDYDLSPAFRLGFSEAVVTPWGGPLTFYHLLQPIPVLSGVIASYDLHDALGQSRNMSVAVDFDWVPRVGVRLYGVGYIDDAPERIAERRARVGLLGGVSLADPFRNGRTSLRLEYSAVTNGTYSYALGLEHAYRGRSLGHWLGPDGDDVYLELTHRLNPATDLLVSFASSRHGEGRIGQSPPPPEAWFLSGVVEHRQTLGLQLQKRYGPSLEMKYRAELSRVANRGNRSGEEAWEGLLGVEFTYRWPAAAAPSSPASAPGRPLSVDAPATSIQLRSWSAATASRGPLAGPPSSRGYAGLTVRRPLGTFALTFDYDGAEGEAFWSAEVHYPVARFRDGAVSVFAGWGGLTSGTVAASGPRLGAAFDYRLAFGDRTTPLYVSGSLSSPLLRGIWAPREGGAPFYLWTYYAGLGWRAGRFNLEAGYRGAVAERRVGTPELTVMRWDGYYVSLQYGFR
ncbi:MAG: capsule assembly Wzi family protein [Armatimonadota bacterium]|nr:capsule assembly Wzi family protein [Armatimonadota bacterium]